MFYSLPQAAHSAWSAGLGSADPVPVGPRSPQTRIVPFVPTALPRGASAGVEAHHTVPSPPRTPAEGSGGAGPVAVGATFGSRRRTPAPSPLQHDDWRRS